MFSVKKTCSKGEREEEKGRCFFLRSGGMKTREVRSSREQEPPPWEYPGSKKEDGFLERIKPLKRRSKAEAGLGRKRKNGKGSS
jgi:hypothetical protein